MNTHPICRLIGHTGHQSESGFHVCDRCGLHEYYSQEEYQRCAALLVPWWWLVRKLQRIRAWFAAWRRLHRDDDDMPF